MSGNFLSCSKGMKDHFEVPDFKCALHRDASEEMLLIFPGWENLLDVFELQQVLLTYDRDFRDLLWWPHERPVSRRLR